jgi:hypothetical protein
MSMASLPKMAAIWKSCSSMNGESTPTIVTLWRARHPRPRAGVVVMCRCGWGVGGEFAGECGLSWTGVGWFKWLNLL